MFKKIKNIALIAFLFTIMGCDDDFAEINTDPNKPSASIFDANLMLPRITNSSRVAGYSQGLLFQSMWTQILASTSTGGANYYSNGDKYVASSSTVSYIQGIWGYYGAAAQAKQMEDLATENGLVNLAAIGKIMQITNIALISDTYGDVPYAEALQAVDGITAPVYQGQQAAYTQMLGDLETSLLALDNGAASPTNDVVYDGDIDKWRKYGYSIMLKMAMRVSEVDAALAQSYITKAVAGGVFTSAADDATLPGDQANGFSNGNANALNVVDDVYEVRWSKTFIDYLASTDDPRLGVIAEIPPAGISENKNPLSIGDSDPLIQIGLPNGFDLRGGATDITTHPDYPGASGAGDDIAPIGNYSRPTGFYRNRDVPWFIITYAETQFLLAEAAVRGLGAPGTAADYYSNGLIAAMESMNKLGGTPIDTGAAYAAANPLDTSSTEASVQMISEQYWATVGSFGNYVEAWSNWRRTDYPVLQDVNYTGNFSGGTIPVRQPYPAGEANTNTANYEAAINAIGGSEDWTTKVWWDVN